MHLKCPKGVRTADDIPLETGPNGARAAIIMPTARWGKIKWVDSKPAEMDIGRVEEGFPVPTNAELPEGWNPYTDVLCVFVDNEHRGASGTFTSSAWGGLFASMKLIKPYARTRAYPICTFSTKPRNDEEEH
jgi:hypothetical protein